MPVQAMDASALLRLIRSDPELRQAVMIDPLHRGSSEASVRAQTRWAIGFSLTFLLVFGAAQAIAYLWTPLPENELSGMLPAWMLRVATLGPLSMQLLVGVFVWTLTKALAVRRERRIAHKLLDALAPGFDRRGLGLGHLESL
jgi:hypothetical protein